MSTDALEALMKEGKQNVKILNATVNLNPADVDPLLEHSREQIQGA
jgi:hypothetical protein